MITDLRAVCTTHHVHLLTRATPCASYCTVEIVETRQPAQSFSVK